MNVFYCIAVTLEKSNIAVVSATKTLLTDTRLVIYLVYFFIGIKNLLFH